MPIYLQKSSNNKIIAGVCGGFAEYFCIDPTIVRLLWALSFFLGGLGLFAYIIAVIIMPEGTENSNDKDYNNPSKRHKILGIILIFVGAYFLLERFLPTIHFHLFWPIMLIILGIFILIKEN